MAAGVTSVMQSRSVSSLAAMVALTMAGVSVARPNPRYVSEKYGLTFDLPLGTDVCRSQAPQPDHGLLFRPKGMNSPPCTSDPQAGTRYTSVDAHFDVDGLITPSNFVTKLCHDLALDSQGKVSSLVVPAGLESSLKWVGCRIDGADKSIQEVLYARRDAAAGEPPIDYTLVLKTTPRSYQIDRCAFNVWLGTVRLTSPVPKPQCC